jgi:acyl-CoA thioester hydrolase
MAVLSIVGGAAIRAPYCVSVAAFVKSRAGRGDWRCAILRLVMGTWATDHARVAAEHGDIAAPFDRYRDVVRPEWIDHNRHMNMGYYLLVFDLATDEWLRYVGLDEAHRDAHQVTTFCLEAHVTYHREVREGDPLRFTTHLLDHDAKRIHYFHEMHHAAEGYLAATNELMTLHVSRQTRRAFPMAAAIRERLALIQAAHAMLPRPAQVGRRIGLASVPTTR